MTNEAPGGRYLPPAARPTQHVARRMATANCIIMLLICRLQAVAGFARPSASTSARLVPAAENVASGGFSITPATTTGCHGQLIRLYSMRGGEGSSEFSRQFLPIVTSSDDNAKAQVRLYSSASTDDATSSDNDRKARVVFLGTPEVAATSLQTLFDATQNDPACPFEVVGVVTQPPKRRKRRGKEIPSPVGLVAEELDIPVLCPEKAKDKDFLDALENDMRPDLCITAAYGQYLTKRFLAMPQLGTLNIHPSLLPRWRGASPVQRSLEAGDQPIGVTVLFTVSKMDAGPIVAQEEYEVDADEQATTVLPHLFDVGTKLLLDAMPDVISGEITMENARQQNEEEVVNAAMIASSEGELKVWKEDATTCHNKARGFSMWPSTYMYFQIGDDEDADESEPVRVKILKTHVVDEKAEPTRVVELGPKKGDGLRVVCHDGSVLEALQVQPATKKAMDAKSFINGMRGQTLRWVEMPEESEDAE